MQHVAAKDTENINSTPSVLKSALFMALGTLLSRILGMVREMVLAALFPRMISDAFVVAFRLPNLFRRVLGEGSLSASFIPVYIEAKNKDPQTAREFKNSIYTMLSVLTATLSVLGIIFMEPLLKILVGGDGFASLPGKMDLAVSMARIMFGYLYLITTYAFLMGVANSHGSFFLPSMAAAVFNGVFSILAFMPSIRFEGDQLAWSVVIAGVFQLIVAGWPLYQKKLLPQWSATFRSKEIRHFFRSFVPSMIGMGIGQFLALFNVYFASRLAEGTHSYIYFADRILEIPLSLLSVSLGVALLPTLSEHWSKNEKEKMLEASQKHIRILLMLSLPAAVGLFILAEPIVEVIYQRGQFKSTDTHITGQVLAIFALSLIFSSVHRVTLPAFYAIKNTWVPATISGITLVAHYFIADWATTKWAIQGLAGATVISGFFNLSLLILAYKKWIGPFGFKRLIVSVIHLFPSLIALALTCYFGMRFFKPLLGVPITLILVILVGGLLFFTVSLITKHSESSDIVNLIIRRFKKIKAK
jgi:putative peptidoglycan lipid II flippase